MPTKKSPERKYLFVGAVALVAFVLLGLRGYYSGKQSSQKTTEIPFADQDNETATWERYENVQYGVEFSYPQNYTILADSDCFGLVENQEDCLISLTIDASNSDYPSKAYFWVLKGIDSVQIFGQTTSVNFDAQKKAWVFNEGDLSSQVLPIWDQTKSGQEIIKTFSGGSHALSSYYLIPNYEEDKLAIFAIPESFRLRCDNFFDDASKEADCENFYQSVIDDYNSGERTLDTWLPENYFSSLYSEAEEMIKSYRRMMMLEGRSINSGM